jgi:hypothetical protein
MTHRSKRALNIQQDSGPLSSISFWASGNAMVLRSFTELDLATRNMLKEEFANRIFVSKHGKLDEAEVDERL